MGPVVRSSAERRLWIAAGVYLAAIYLSLYPAQFVLLWLRARGRLGLTITLLFVVAAALVVVGVMRRRTGPRELGTLALGGAIYVVALSRMSILQERLHLLEYGLLALIILAALRARARAGGRPTGAALPLVAIALTAAAGWGDEGIQAVLPNRVYDLRDVGFNAGAGALAIGIELLRTAARRRDEQRSATEPPIESARP